MVHAVQTRGVFRGLSDFDREKGKEGERGNEKFRGRNTRFGRQLIEMMKELEKTVRNAFPDLDVRSDQCELIRIITSSLTVGIEQHDDTFEADVISLECELDFETELIAKLHSDPAAGLVSQSKAYLK